MSRLSFIPPAQPILVSEPPTGGAWLHEVKFYGWRCQIIKDERGVRIYSRHRADWPRQLPTVVDAVGGIGTDAFIIDGELVGVVGDDFYAIPTAMKRRQVCVVAFDIMHLNGEDVRLRPLEARRAILRGLLGTDGPIIFSEAFQDGAALLREVEARGLEGVVSKRKNTRYKSGICSHWRKTKSAGWIEANMDRFEKVRG